MSTLMPLQPLCSAGRLLTSLFLQDQNEPHVFSHQPSVYLKPGQSEAPHFITTEAQSFHTTVAFTPLQVLPVRGTKVDHTRRVGEERMRTR